MTVRASPWASAAALAGDRSPQWESDGDQQMLEVTADGPGSRRIVLVPHDDAEREFAYDRESRIGRIDKAWD